jgi:hypothetical protein
MPTVLESIYSLFNSIQTEYNRIFITGKLHPDTIIKYHIKYTNILTKQSYTDLKQLLVHMHTIWLDCYTYVLHIPQGCTDEEYKDMYNYIVNIWHTFSECAYLFLEHINTLESQKQNIIIPNEKNAEGTKWFHDLCICYSKLGGIFPTTTYDFIKTFEREWNNLSDIETHTVYDILSTILGGCSVTYNARCLQEWITQNKDVVPNITNWILTSYKSDN